MIVRIITHILLTLYCIGCPVLGRRLSRWLEVKVLLWAIGMERMRLGYAGSGLGGVGAQESGAGRG